MYGILSRSLLVLDTVVVEMHGMISSVKAELHGKSPAKVGPQKVEIVLVAYVYLKTQSTDGIIINNPYHGGSKLWLD